MRPALASLGNLSLAFPGFVIHLIAALAIFLGLTWFYRLAHRFPFLEHVGNHNVAAAIAYGSIQIGFAIPLAACLIAGSGMLDLMIWAVPVGLVQYLCFLVFDAIFHGLPRRIAANDVAVAIMIAASRISVAIIIAGGILD
jgi:uncharacterized membrane protein YjfL (UPF0719 family)